MTQDDLVKYDVTVQTIELMYREWLGGRGSKSKLERRFLGVATHHGKLFTRLVVKYLGIQTARPHQMRELVAAQRHEIDRLQGLLTAAGIDASRSPFLPVPHQETLLIDHTSEYT